MKSLFLYVYILYVLYASTKLYATIAVLYASAIEDFSYTHVTYRKQVYFENNVFVCSRLEQVIEVSVHK